jgi:hypothetical protein
MKKIRAALLSLLLLLSQAYAFALAGRDDAI